MVQEPVALALALYRSFLVVDAGSSRMVVVRSI
ncbi:MAG: Uncharacterised protein [Prochlorococcus marinus str. MIT 9313]|nr:MAG: Uncharacterised protein [Prochlorococcus marinus str. MIT 9313]